MQSVIFLNDEPIITRPRPYRAILALQKSFLIHAINHSYNPDAKQKQKHKILESVNFYNFDPPKRSKERSQKENEEIEKNCRIANFKPLIFTKNREKIPEILKGLDAKLLFVCDITLLPFAVEYKLQKGAKILIDLREFYPLQSQEHSWLDTFGKFFSYLCEEYLPFVDFSISVSEEICAKYAIYNLMPNLYLSLPPRFTKSQKTIKLKKNINIIYHGFLSSDRNSEMLLELGNLILQEGLDFKIYIMGDSNERGFMEKFKQSSVEILDMVPMYEIVPFCAQFDIGILTLSDNNFNNANALPNKLFEYIQSNLMVLSTPHKRIGQILKLYQVGITAEECNAKALLESLKNLSTDKINHYKNNSRRAARDLNLDKNAKKLREWVTDIISP